MLHYSTIYPKTLQLLEALQNHEAFKEFILVGGTSLALQIGHRISIDLDLFSHSEQEIAPVLKELDTFGKIQITNQSSKILNLFIDDIKVDFVSYPFPYLNPALEINKVRLASIEDIAAMKLAAITGRGTKKDFIDLYFILEQFSLPEIFELYNLKYPDGNTFLVYKSLTYFEDAELEPMPNMIKPVSWDSVKERIIDEVQKHFS